MLGIFFSNIYKLLDQTMMDVLKNFYVFGKMLEPLYLTDLILVLGYQSLRCIIKWEHIATSYDKKINYWITAMLEWVIYTYR